MGEIIEQIWELPWYKVLFIAIVDDLILAVKLWPLYIVIVIIALVLIISKRLTRKKPPAKPENKEDPDQV